jgi:spermidine/putrescine transport system ATP-binding protein
MLELINISKSFPGQPNPVVDRLSLTVHKGEFISLLGPSGCGKTTLLRMIAGFEIPQQGEILLNKEKINGYPPQARPFNMVFQRYALFPHLSVFDNVAYGLRMKNFPESEIVTRVTDMLHMVNMDAYRERFPETLSGGQAQRIAVARALVNHPQILLLDEPLSALDQQMRSHMQRELRELQKKLGITFIFVTHDQEEAFVLSDRIALMNEGCIEQLSEPDRLYEDPDTAFSAKFVGTYTELPVNRFKKLGNGYAEFHLAGYQIKATYKPMRDSEILAIVRPEQMALITNNQVPPGYNSFRGQIISKTFRGSETEIEVELAPGLRIRAFMTPQEIDYKDIKIGAEILLAFDPEDTFLFAGDQ